MFKHNGEELLKQFSENAYPYEIKKINKRIYHIVGLGHSNAIAIEGKTSWILVDCLDCDTRALTMKNKLMQIANKPIKTIIFTHGHYDHHAGSGVFKDSVEEVIAFSSRRPILKYYDKLADVLKKRTAHQFGYNLSDEECISQGIGIREGFALGEGKQSYLEPTILYHEDIVELCIDGISIKLVAAIGESDDQLFVWLPDDMVLCCGDNYYGCFPNLYAIRGSQYRDIATWIDSLNNILSYPAKALLSGHTQSIIGYDNIQEILGNYKEAMEFILLNTLECMNKGMSEAEVVENVKLPKDLASKPYLGEFYGTVEWSVRGIYHGYIGWFDGNPTNLAKLSDFEFDSKLISLIGLTTVFNEIENCIHKKEYQMALQLCDLCIHSNQRMSESKALKVKALIGLSKLSTSANGRHYYISCAKEYNP